MNLHKIDYIDFIDFVVVVELLVTHFGQSSSNSMYSHRIVVLEPT